MSKILTKKNLLFIIFGAALLVLFYAFSNLVKEDIFTRFDFDMTIRIQNNVPKRIDPYLSYFSLLGSFEVTLGILLFLLILTRKIQSIMIIGMFGVMHFVEIVGKAILFHPGTPFMFHRYSLDIIFPTSYVQPGGSYPSGHAMRAAYLLFLLIFIIFRTKRLSKTFKLLSYIAISAIFTIMISSRVSLGEHWTTDVIGGSILGLAFALFSFVFI